MELGCPRCHESNPPAARFCRRCGVALTAAPAPGRTPHPQPLAAPAGFEAMASGANLLFRCRPLSGNTRLTDAEGCEIAVFNAGHGLCNVSLRVLGWNDAAEQVMALTRDLPDLPRGATAMVEVSSYDLPAPVRRIAVDFCSAEFSSATDAAG